MDLKEKIKDFYHKLKIFLWYLLTEPLRQLKDILRMIHNVILALNKTLTWVYIAVAVITISLFYGQKYISGIFVLFLLVVVLLWEWERGFFMYRHKEAIKNKVMKEAEKNGTGEKYGNLESKDGKIPK